MDDPVKVAVVMGDKEEDDLDESWMEEECFRISGEMICEVCDKEYWRHPQPAKKVVPTLVRGCDGRLYKL